MNKPANNQNIIDQDILIDNLIRSRRIDFALSFAVGNGKFKQLPLARMIYIEANKELATIYFDRYEREKISVCQSISQCEKQLSDYGFYRIHRAYMINLSFLEKIICSGKSYTTRLLGKIQLPIARRKQKLFLQQFSTLQLDRLLEK